MLTMPGMSQRWINVDLLTTDYRIVGKVLVGNSGLQGLLADTAKSFIEVRQAQIAYLHQPTHIINSFDSTFLVKDRIYIACLQQRDFAGQQPYAHRAYTSYQSYLLHISFSGFELECSIEWTGRFDMSALLVDKTGSFMLVYDADLASSFISGFAVNTPAAMVNMNRVDLISLVPEQV